MILSACVPGGTGCPALHTDVCGHGCGVRILNRPIADPQPANRVCGFHIVRTADRSCDDTPGLCIVFAGGLPSIDCYMLYDNLGNNIYVIILNTIISLFIAVKGFKKTKVY